MSVMNPLWPLGTAFLPAAERTRMERIGDALSGFARDRGLRLVLIVLGTVIAVRLVRIALFFPRSLALAHDLNKIHRHHRGAQLRSLDVISLPH